MSTLPLTPDELLATTRSVRKRLDFTRPVERSVLEECLALAQQAPTGSNLQNWHFVVVTDPVKRAALAEICRRGWDRSRGVVETDYPVRIPVDHPARHDRVRDVEESALYLRDRLHEVPVHVIPCITGRTDGRSVAVQAGWWGSIVPATWSFMLAARARGLGTCWTTVHLFYEAEAAALLGIPYHEVMQTALIPVAYTLGTDFKPARRAPLATMVHWDGW